MDFCEIVNRHADEMKQQRREAEKASLRRRRLKGAVRVTVFVAQTIVTSAVLLGLVYMIALMGHVLK